MQSTDTIAVEIPAAGAAAIDSTSVLETIAPWTGQVPVLTALAGIGVLFVAAWFALVVVRKLALRVVGGFTRRTSTMWDEALLHERVIRRASWIVPVFILHRGIHLVPYVGAGIENLFERVSTGVLILIGVRVFAAFLDGVNDVYSRFPSSRERPIKGLLQVVSIIAHIMAMIFILAALLDQTPWVLFSGLGAMTAILLLIFQNSILSFVAGIQLTANNLIRVGDWIEMPQFNADGDVVDMALNSVSVQNWDKTITVIPAHKFLENSFKNWRGMQMSGGRRIKRAIHLDMSTVRFLSQEEVERFGRFVLLKEYVSTKVAEIEEYNRENAVPEGMVANARRQTNVGMFRAYVTHYLRQHPMIHKDLTFLVRQLQPTPQGLPLEIYVFVNDVRWAVYEGVQADIFDHLLSMVPEFGLRVFQEPSGADFASLAAGRSQ